MTRRRWLAVAGMLACLVCLGLGVFAILPPRPGVTKENFDRIQIGMTNAEVEQIFGSVDNPLLNILLGGGCVGKPGFSQKFWAERNMNSDYARIRFNDEGHVCEKEWSCNEELFFDKLRRWLHL